MGKPLSIFELMNNNKYSIPLYQRNFAWTYDEISQLIIDVLDSIKSRREEYYIGTLVVSEDNGEYSIIDGQQRFTALLLISLAIQNNYRDSVNLKYINKINLKFSARKRSDITLKNLFEFKDNINNDELSRGYENAKNALSAYVMNDEEYSDITMMDFYDYLFNKVKIFLSIMPIDLDLNLYFERFNSRGEQLEFHEIIKAELMQKLLVENTDLTVIRKFAKIWDACSEFETPVISFFKKKTKSSDIDDERERVFLNKCNEYEPGKKTWKYEFEFDNIYDSMTVADENKKSLLDVLESENCISDDNKSDKENETDEPIKYRCIINFNTFLYYVLYLTDNKEPNEIQLDDKKLNRTFAVSTRNKEWILKLGENLLKLKFIFDNLIIRNSLETNRTRVEGEWFLQKAHRVDKNDKKKGHLYVQTRYDKNSFETNNREILMLQSMFAVTFTANKDTKWLYIILKFLFENASKLSSSKFGIEFMEFLEDLSITYAKERFCSGGIIDPVKLRCDKGVPIYAFNFTDYALWKKRLILKKDYPGVNFDKFSFKYRRSIEHWYPQNKEENDESRKMDNDLLHSFGNLGIISASQNSKFSNLDPMAKLANWRSIFKNQSLKMQIMAAKTDEWREWDNHKKDEIKDIESSIIKLLNEYINKF